MLHIPRKLAETIFDLAYEGLPRKVCGFLGGKEGVVSTIIPVTNIAAIGDHYSMDPGEQLDAMKKLQENELDLLGIYHSHLDNPAFPTVADINLPLSSDVSHIIVSLRKLDNPVLKSFRISAGHVEPEQVDYL
jgi:proteasome lid subunit RPN8/RPN11